MCEEESRKNLPHEEKSKENLPREEQFSEKPPDDNGVRIIALEEMRRRLDIQFGVIDSLDAKTSTFIEIASLVVALATVLKIIDNTSAINLLDWIGIGIGIISLSLLMFLFVLSYRVRKVLMPIVPDWDSLNVNLINKSPKAAIEGLINAYIKVINENKRVVFEKKRFLDISIICFSIIIFSFIVVIIF
jgi:hypothetical protein